jgi:hypothetical protein
VVEVSKEDEVNAIKALSGVFSQSMTQLTTASNDQMLAIMGTAALVACLPETRDIPPQRIGAIINLLSKGRPDAEAFRQKLAQFVAMLMTMSKRLDQAEADKPNVAEPGAVKH